MLDDLIAWVALPWLAWGTVRLIVDQEPRWFWIAQRLGERLPWGGLPSRDVSSQTLLKRLVRESKGVND